MHLNKKHFIYFGYGVLSLAILMLFASIAQPKPSVHTSVLATDASAFAAEPTPLVQSQKPDQVVDQSPVFAELVMPTSDNVLKTSLESVHELRLGTPSHFLFGLADTTINGQSWLKVEKHLTRPGTLFFDDHSTKSLDVWRCRLSLDMKTAVNQPDAATLLASYDENDKLVTIQLLLPMDHWDINSAMKWIDLHYDHMHCGNPLPGYTDYSATYMDDSGMGNQIRIDATGNYPDYPGVVVIQFISGQFLAHHEAEKARRIKASHSLRSQVVLPPRSQTARGFFLFSSADIVELVLFVNFMSKRNHSVLLLTPGTLSKAIVVIAILGGLLVTYRTTPSHASQPPGGGGVEEIYVDNMKGNDNTADGSQLKPFATIEKANHRVNVSGAGMVRMLVRPTGSPYPLVYDFYPKRNNVEFLVWGTTGRPQIVGNQGDYLSRFDIQKFSGIRLEGFDLRDVALTIRGGEHDTIRNNNIAFSDIGVSKLVRANNDGNTGAIISSYIWDLTPPENYITEDLTIDHNNLKAASGIGGNSPAIIGIRLQSDRAAKVYNNTYSRVNAGDVLVSVFDSIDSEFAANSYTSLSNKQAVYSFDHTNTSRVYNIWPF